MKKFKVVVEETICQEFEVVANSLEEAAQITKMNYDDEKIVVDNPTVESRQILVYDEDKEGECKVWSEI